MAHPDARSGRRRSAGAGRPSRLPGGHRPATGRRALLVAGTHGDEPAGPRALLRFFASGQAAGLRDIWSLDVLPLVNPLGFDRGRRGRPGCRDLNRAFGTPPRCPETAAIAEFVAGERRDEPASGSGSGLAATRSADPLPRWDLVLSLHEDPERYCLYLYDSGHRNRHDFAGAIAHSVAFLDLAEKEGTEICSDAFLEGSPNCGGVLLAAQNPCPALEPMLYRAGAAQRVVIVETPGMLALPAREALHLSALRHYLALRTARPARNGAPSAAYTPQRPPQCRHHQEST